MSTNNEIVLVGKEDRKSETEAVIESCFSFKRESTDWDYWLGHPEQISIDAIIGWFKLNEPLPMSKELHGVAWAKNQLLRIRMRHDRKLPLTSSYTCASCGTRKGDSVTYENICLHCKEYVNGVDGSRGSCYYIKPAFDPKTNSWGILYYDYHKYDDHIIVMIAVGFKSIEHATECLYAVHKLYEYVVRQTKGLFWASHFSQAVYSLGSVMDQPLPMSANEFKEYTKRRMAEVLNGEEDALAYYVGKSIAAYDEAHRR